MNQKSVKIVGLIIGIILFIGLLAGITYAYYHGKATATINGNTCFDINATNGGNITNANLLLFDENEIIDNGNITIKDGMAVTSISAGIDSGCNIGAYLSIDIANINMNSNFVSGDSVGALKYIVSPYSSSEYPTANLNTVKNHSFKMLATGSITSTDTKTIFADILPKGSMKDYLVIFYIDGDLAGNGIGTGTTNFSSTIKGIATQSKTDDDNTNFISKLYNVYPKETVANNNINYDLAPGINLMKDTQGNIRYYGASPNNYIKFNCESYPDTNCELWRIVGIVDGKIKLMRNESIGLYSWDSGARSKRINQWGPSTYAEDGSIYEGASLMKLLNPGYESNQDVDSTGATATINNSLYYNSGSGICYNGNNATTPCDFTNTGIKNNSTKNKIALITYYTGFSGSYAYSNQILVNERSANIISNPSDGVVRTTRWDGRVAIPYVSDYAYAADLNLCKENIGGYDKDNCKNNNWMSNIMTNSGVNMGYFINPSTSTSGYSYYAWENCSVTYGWDSGNIYYKKAVVPVLSINSNVQIDTEHAGSIKDPYTINN